MGTLLRNPADGKTYDVQPEQASRYIAQGYEPVSTEARSADVQSQALDARARDRGALGTVNAAASSALSGLTVGGSDVLLGAALSEGEKERLRGDRAANPIVSTVSNVAGALVPALLTGGTSSAASAAALTPASAVARLGAGIAKAGEGAGAVTRLGRSVAGGVVEGTLQSAGDAAGELALSKDPLTAERIASTLSSKMLFGGAIGGAAGGLGKLAEIGLTKAKGVLDAAAEGGAARANALGTADDLVGLDAKGLRAAREAELAAIGTARIPQRQALADDLAAFRKESKDSKIWLATKEADDAEVRVIGKQSFKADRQLDQVLDNPKYLADNPKAALAALQKQEHALEQLAAKADDLRVKFDSEHATRQAARDSKGLPKYGEIDDALTKSGDDYLEATVPASSLKSRGWYEPAGGHLDPVRVAKARQAMQEGQRDAIKLNMSETGKITVTDGRHRLAAAAELDLPIKVKWSQGFEPAAHDVFQGGAKAATSSSRSAALDKIAPTLERNRALQAKIGELTAAPASGRLSAIDDAKDALSIPARPKSMAEQMASGSVYGAAAGLASAIPFIGSAIAPFVGAKAAGYVGEKVFGRLAKAGGEVAARTSKAVGAFVDVAKKAAPVAPVLATKVLSNVSFAPGSERKEAPGGTHRERIAPLFHARAEELRSQVAIGPDGKAAMRPEAREQVARQLAPIAAFNPLLADQMETIAARRVEFLADKMPRRPDIAGMPIGPDLWKPSDMEMRTWARYVAAVEDPGGIEERLTDGSVTPEDAEVMRSVYPERMAAITQQIVMALPTLRQSLPYHRRIALSVFSGVPVDAAMDPRVLNVLQGAFKAEKGTEGGVQPPKPSPAFGSVRAEGATPAQGRAQGAAA
jgi:hypothetical protein